MTGQPPLRPICLVGPPAAGKTTLAEHLGRTLPAPVYRPRSVVLRAIGNEPAVIGLFPRDRLGFVPDEALGYALRSVLDHLSGPVVLENLPWNALNWLTFTALRDTIWSSSACRYPMISHSVAASSGVTASNAIRFRQSKRPATLVFGVATLWHIVQMTSSRNLPNASRFDECIRTRWSHSPVGSEFSLSSSTPPSLRWS